MSKPEEEVVGVLDEEVVRNDVCSKDEFAREIVSINRWKAAFVGAALVTISSIGDVLIDEISDKSNDSAPSEMRQSWETVRAPIAGLSFVCALIGGIYTFRKNSKLEERVENEVQRIMSDRQQNSPKP